MKYHKRSFISVKRQKTKTVILFFIILILSNLIFVGISIKKSTQLAEKTIKDQLGTKLTISEDADKLDSEYEKNGFVNYEFVSSKDLKTIGNLDTVEYLDYSIPTYVQVQNLVRADSSNSDEELVISTMPLIGVNQVDFLAIKEKNIKIVDGNPMSVDNIDNGHLVTIISSEMAKKNGLSVGDNLHLSTILGSMNDYDFKNGVTHDIELSIVGLYDLFNVDNKKESELNSNEGSEGKELVNEIKGQLNNIYVPNIVSSDIEKRLMKIEIDNFPENFSDTTDNLGNKIDDPKEIYEQLSAVTYTQPVIILKSAESLNQFKEDSLSIMKKYPYLKFLVSSDYYIKIAASIINMNKIANYILIGSVLSTICIMLLVVNLFLKDRKKEIGIYLSLGESRAKIFFQLLLEIFIIFLFSTTLSVFTGNVITKTVSNSLLYSQKNSDESNTDDDFDSYGYSMLSADKVSKEDVATSYELSLNKETIVIYYLISIITITGSAAVSLIFVWRLNPQKILMQH